MQSSSKRLLTKCELKMAAGISVSKTQKKKARTMPALRQLVSKYRINLATHPALTGNQSERRIRFILPSRGNSHIIKKL